MVYEKDSSGVKDDIFRFARWFIIRVMDTVKTELRVR